MTTRDLMGPTAGTVLVLGDDGQLAQALQLLLPDVRVRTAQTAVETGGIGTNVVVVGGSFPLEELTEVRVHPHLFELPVVLVAPGHYLKEARWQADAWRAIDVWPVTKQDPSLLDAVADQVARLLARIRHSSMRGRRPTVGAAS